MNGGPAKERSNYLIMIAAPTGSANMPPFLFIKKKYASIFQKKKKYAFIFLFLFLGAVEVY